MSIELTVIITLVQSLEHCIKVFIEILLNTNFDLTETAC